MGIVVLLKKPPKPLIRAKAHILIKHSTRHSLQNLHQDSVLELLEGKKLVLQQGDM